MNRSLAAAVGLAATLLLTSCTIDSVHPLSSPDKAQADRRLVGTWRTKDGGTLTFTATHGSWMHVKTVGPPDDNEKPGSFDVFPTVIGDSTFLNVTAIDSSDFAANHYLFLRYTITSGHTLQMWMMSQDETVAAVRSEKLRGQIKATGLELDRPRRPDYDVTLQDSSAHIFKFIKNSDGTALFQDPMEPSQKVAD